MKRKLGLVLLVLGIITTIEAKRTSLRSTEEVDEVDEVAVVEEQPHHKVRMSSSQPSKKERERERKEARKKVAEPKKNSWSFFDVSPQKEERAKRLYSDLAVGFIKYTMPKITLVNAINVDNTVSLEHASVMPMIRGGMGVELVGLPCLMDKEKTTRARIGWQALYAKKNAAVETLFVNSSSTVPTLLGIQDVERGEFMAVFSYDLVRDIFSLEGGMGVVGGALKDFELFQPPVTGSTVIVPSYYTGQRLVPHKANFGGFIGANLCHRFKDSDRLLFEVGYRCVFSSVKYHTTIYQDQPGILANQVFQNGFSASQTGLNAVLPSEPKFKVRAQEISFGIVAEF
jgi:hypothetical protein